MHAICFPDYSDSIPADFVVWCLQISPYDEQNDVGPFGLILITENGSVFHRGGILVCELEGIKVTDVQLQASLLGQV
jgi:hypothetical protein